ncbi:MAG: hypothetical protein K2I72_01785 [Bacilli bacterium]|nr:hypothetical protein [Bacilli bacterium]
MKALEEYTLEEINKIEDLELRRNLQKFYQQKILELGNTPFSRRVIKNFPGFSIMTLQSILQSEYLECTSFYHFPNKQVCFYPSIHEYKSEFNTTCAFSGGPIKKGSFYYCYRPLLEVVDSGKKYVLRKTLKLETMYFSDLPTSIQEFDDFTTKVEHYWLYPNERLDYECLNYYFGGSVGLLELGKRKGKRKKKK